jgi:putative NADPH-quinone reductase
MARIVVIQGHPDPRGGHFCHALAEAYAGGAREGSHMVETIAVAKLDFSLLRTAEEWHATPPPDIRLAQEAVARSDHLVIIYPLWMGSPPALLQAFFEHLFREGFAVQPAGPGGGMPKKLLGGKSARVIVTMGMPAAAYRWFFLAHSLRSLKRNVLGLCGIAPVRDTLIGGVEAPGADSARRGWLEKVKALGRDAR